MAVDVVCPHCDTKYHLQPDMLGKAMRCPECKDIFTVTSSTVPPPVEVPYERIEQAPPVVLEAEALPPLPQAVALPKLPTAIPLPDDRPKPADRRSEPALPKAAALPKLPTAIPLPDDKPKEVEWRAEPAVQEADWRSAPPPPESRRDTPLPAKLDLDVPKPKRNIWPLVLTSLIMAILLLGVGAGAIYLYKDSQKESVLAEKAEVAFKDRNFGEAAKLFDELLQAYPESASGERYKFLQALSALENALGSVGLRDDPASLRPKWEAFLKEYAGSPLAKVDDGYGVDIFDAGRKLAEGYAGHAEDRLKKFRNEYAKRELLTDAEASVKESRSLIPIVDRYRPRDVPPLDDLKARLDGLDKEFVRERKRLEVIDPYRDLAADPVEERIAEFVAALARHGFSDDAEGKELISAAALRLRSLLTPLIEFHPPLPVKAGTDEKVFLGAATPAGALAPPPPYPEVDTFFAAARGWLYAFDADRGDLLWTTRTGTATPPLRAVLADGGSDLAIVASVADGKAGITARRARTGEALWHQPLPAAVAGASAIVGHRLYVPLADAAGTMMEFDLITGHRLSTLGIRQRIGPGIVRIPETTMIAIVAEARRIFILDAAPLDANGERQPLKLLHVLRSEHPVLSLRVPPAFCGSGKPTMILVQNDGLTATKVRAVLLPEFPPLAADAAVPETAATDLATATLPGQVSFPPAADGERVAIVTDAGVFAVYRTNAPGNLDSGLFSLPNSVPNEAARESHPAVAAISSEDATWVFAKASRMQFLQSFAPVSGFRVVPRGIPVPAGLPAQPVQIFSNRGAAGIVLRSENSDAWRAVLFDLASGRERWTRTLGTVSVATIPLKDGTLIVDEDGGVQMLTAANSERIAAPIVPTAGTALVAKAANGDCWIVVPSAKNQVRVREVKAGKLALDVDAALPAMPAGEPVILGDSIAIPLADGFLYRFDSSTKSFLAGPMWRGSASTDAKCFAATIGDEIFATDGARKLGRWRWPGGAEWSAVGSGFETRDRIAFAPLLLGRQILVAEAGGALVLFDMDRGGESVKRWRPSEESTIPQGRPSVGFRSFGPLAVYSVDGRHLVALDPANAQPAWIITREAGDYDLLDFSVIGDRLAVTDLAGNVTLFDAKGKLVAQFGAKGRERLPRLGIAPLGEGFLLPMADGSIVTLPKAAP